MFDGIINNIQMWGAGIVVAAVLAIAIKKIPSLLGNWLKDKLNDLYALGDDIDDALLRAACIWIKAKCDKYFPESSDSDLKYMKLAENIISKVAIFRLLIKPSKLAELLKTIVETVEKAAEEGSSHA